MTSIHIIFVDVAVTFLLTYAPGTSSILQHKQAWRVSIMADIVLFSERRLLILLRLLYSRIKSCNVIMQDSSDVSFLPLCEHRESSHLCTDLQAETLCMCKSWMGIV
jgi:hypothetical protein